MLTDDLLQPLMARVEVHFGLIARPLTETLRTALLEMARGQGIDPRDLAVRLASPDADASEVVDLISRLLLGHTHFYRHARVWEWLGESMARFVPKGPVRALVAGCSSGEEAYTLAALLTACYGISGFEVVAVDVNESALEQGRTGTYSTRDLAKLPTAWRERFLEPGGDGTARFHAALRSRVRFTWGNITQGLPGGPYHIVTVRNVLTYMTAPATRSILNHIRRNLVPGGLLIVAPHEAFLVAEAAVFSSVAQALPIYCLGDLPVVDAPPERSSAPPASPGLQLEAPESPVPAPAEVPLPTGDLLTVACHARVLFASSPHWADLSRELRYVLRQPPPRLLVDLSVVHRVDNQVQLSLGAAVRLLEAAGTRVELRRGWETSA